jgi:hypothetical protein
LVAGQLGEISLYFDSEKPRKFLEKNGFVVTFRTYHYAKRSYQYAAVHDNNDRFGKKYLSGIIVCNLKDVCCLEDLIPFVEFSGFEDVEEWAEEIFRLDHFRLPFSGGFKKLGNLCFVVRV